MSKSHLELLLLEHIKDRALPEPQPEYPYALSIGRKWRADLAWPDLKLLVEVEGGIRLKHDSAHTGPGGYTKDCRKYNDAVFLGWSILRFTAQMINTFEAVNTIQEFITERMVNDD